MSLPTLSISSSAVDFSGLFSQEAQRPEPLNEEITQSAGRTLQTTRWCLTLNNWTEIEYDHIISNLIIYLR